MTVTRPALRYPGGKWLLGKWILSYMPEHNIYIEAFGGAGSVLLQKERVWNEVFNDMDERIVNFFRVLQDRELYEELCHRLKFTLFSRSEYDSADMYDDNPVIAAQALLIKSYMGYGNLGKYSSSFRTNSKVMNRTSPALDWKNYSDEIIDAIRQRFMGVTIEKRPAIDVMQGHDTVETLHYVDPPYPLSTRSRKYYEHEMTDEDHEELADALHKLEGMVLLSGYQCDLYDDLFKDWQRVDRHALAEGARERVESLWLNPALSNALEENCDEWTGLPGFEPAKLKG